MSKCPNCDLPVTMAPWRYDDADHGIHWVCPTGNEPEFIYAPVSFAEAIRDHLGRQPQGVQRLIG